MARTMWAFNILKAKDASGQAIEPPTGTHPGFLAVPVKFPCVFEPRSQKHADIVDQEWLSVKDKGAEWSRVKSTI